MAEQGGRVAIVTGASKGIGAAIAQRLARDGNAVVVNYSRGRDAADAVVAAIEKAGGRAVAVGADVGSLDGVKMLFDEAEKAFGGVDILVNNAGVMQITPMENVTDEEFDHHVAVNIGGVFRGMREGARRLREGGRIVSFSTSVIGLYQPGYGVYAATKGAVEAMTHILAKELAPKNITVNAVAPGATETDMFMVGKSDELIQRIAALNPFKRLGRADDIASVVSFLAGPDSSWVSGQIIRANGGIV